jgi:dTDP-4-amino-4,6-dideoxygalactose transaminase
VRAGGEPVFADVDPETLNIDPESVKRAIRAEQSARNDNTGSRNRSGSRGKIKALLPVHLYGQCAHMDALQQIASEFKLVVIEDAAQAIGAKWRERSAGSMGTCAAFSFYPTKNLSAYGDAGIVTTQDAARAAHMRQLRNHGSPERYLHTEFGWNARMDAIQAAVLRVKLKYIDKWNQQRRERAQTYERLIGEAGLVAGNSAPLRRPRTSPHAFHVLHQYVIRAQRRDELRKFLAARGIATEIYYPVPLHLQPVFAYLGYKEGDLPESERAAREVLALPMFPELTEEEQRQVVAGIAEYYSA